MRWFESTGWPRMSDKQMYTRRSVLKLSGAAAATAVGGSAVSPAAAQTNDGPSGLFADETLSGQVAAGFYFVAGLADGVTASVTNAFGEREAGAIDTHVSAIVDEFTAHKGDWLTYVNDRGLGGSNRQTLAVTFRYAGETRERYVVADYSDGAYQSVSVQTPDEWSQGSADLEAAVSDEAVENGASELQALHDRYIAPNTDIERSYASQLAGRYYFAPNDHVSVPESLLG